MESLSDGTLGAVWNRRSDVFIRGTGGEQRQKRASDVLEMLREAGFSPRGKRILDIGCGPGTHTLPLAREGAVVTALDISEAMLNRIRETALEEKLDITTQEGSWWSLDIDKRGFRNSFDLVIASMTPGVRDRETFDRMMACSKGYCYYSNFISKAGDRLLPEI
ncbi:MAG: methyltransferase domain-containing protein, partial [Methanomicrobiales archaeon]|nr:methyltransferase domain-containing protein [Methanomicrobiales archaeon]